MQVRVLSERPERKSHGLLVRWLFPPERRSSWPNRSVIQKDIFFGTFKNIAGPFGKIPDIQRIHPDGGVQHGKQDHGRERSRKRAFRKIKEFSAEPAGVVGKQ
jgi:hypothetical protein